MISSHKVQTLFRLYEAKSMMLFICIKRPNIHSVEGSK